MFDFETNNPTVNKLISEGIQGYKNGMNRLVGNYIKRRNVGFTISEAASGSWKDVKKYYNDVFTGREHKDPIEAFRYIDK